MRFFLVLFNIAIALFLYIGLIEVGVTEPAARIFGAAAFLFLLLLRILSDVHAEKVAKLLKKKED